MGYERGGIESGMKFARSFRFALPFSSDMILLHEPVCSIPADGWARDFNRVTTSLGLLSNIVFVYIIIMWLVSLTFSHSLSFTPSYSLSFPLDEVYLYTAVDDHNIICVNNYNNMEIL